MTIGHLQSKNEGLAQFEQALERKTYDSWLRGLDLNQRPSGYENVLKQTAH